jgi:transcriptional regulator with XRE-family HTH domain
MNDRLAIGRRIREARENLGWTQHQLGEQYGCSHAAISDIERGVTNLGITDLGRLAEILGKDVDFFLRPTSIQLRHDPRLKGSQRRLKDDFVRYVRSLSQRSDTEK